MNRVSDCHDGRCKSNLDQIEEEREYSEFEISPQYCIMALGRLECTHVVYKGNEWCLTKGWPEVQVTGTKYAVFSL